MTYLDTLRVGKSIKINGTVYEVTYNGGTYVGIKGPRGGHRTLLKYSNAEALYTVPFGAHGGGSVKVTEFEIL